MSVKTWMGVNAVRSHMESSGHQSRMHRRSEQLPISMFCSSATATSPQTSTAPPQATASGSTVSRPTTTDVRQQTLCPTSMLRAEVLWCLGTATKHHSYSSNEGIGELFRNMFMDSEIAKNFACGKDKTSYIIKFGLAPYFKKKLIASVNKAGPFILMFDESLNTC